MLDGTLVFGSRWAGGVYSPLNAAFWEDMVADGRIPLDEIRKSLSHIFAFDQFVCNEDRHAGNYLLSKPNTRNVVYAFDYSRAWIAHGFPLPKVPLGVFCNTMLQRARFLKKWNAEYLDPVEIEKTLEKIETVPVSKIQRIIDEHPVDWLPQATRSDILTWWGSSALGDRVKEILAGVKNGSCL